jgi:hypothetical protein
MWVRDEHMDVDVTAAVTWSASDSSFSDCPTSSSVAIVASPGVIRPVRRGSVSIHVCNASGHRVALHAYAVDPAGPAVPLAPYVGGLVSEANGATPIVGAVVEIIDGGVDTGKTDTTRVNGTYFIEHIRMGMPFTVRASKPGYLSAESRHPGFVDNESGSPQPSNLPLRLTKAPAT